MSPVPMEPTSLDRERGSSPVIMSNSSNDLCQIVAEFIEESTTSEESLDQWINIEELLLNQHTDTEEPLDQWVTTEESLDQCTSTEVPLDHYVSVEELLDQCISTEEFSRKKGYREQVEKLYSIVVFDVPAQEYQDDISIAQSKVEKLLQMLKGDSVTRDIMPVRFRCLFSNCQECNVKEGVKLIWHLWEGLQQITDKARKEFATAEDTFPDLLRLVNHTFSRSPDFDTLKDELEKFRSRHIRMGFREYEFLRQTAEEFKNQLEADQELWSSTIQPEIEGWMWNFYVTKLPAESVNPPPEFMDPYEESSDEDEEEIAIQ